MDASSSGSPQSSQPARDSADMSNTPELNSAIMARLNDVDGPGAVHVIVQHDEVRVLLSGEIDASLASEFRSAINVITTESLPVTLDAHYVSFMDSFGVAFVSQVALAAPTRVRMVHVPPTVRFLLDVTQTSDLVDLSDADY